MGTKRKRAGNWRQERERCHVDKKSPPAGVGNPVSISSLVPVLMKKLGMADEHWLNVLEEEWEQIAGSAVAGHTRPGRIAQKQLTVFVDSSVWMNELTRYGKDELLANLQSRFGKKEIREVRFSLDPDNQS